MNSADVAETEGALQWLLDTYMRRPVPSAAPIGSFGKSYLSDESVIEKASLAKNGEKFQRLWNGDITGFAFHSEADAALCSILTFWCGGDREQMDRLFRKSGLMRDKWDACRGTDTYGDLAISKALSGMTSFYTPVRVPSASEDCGMARLAELDPMDAAKYPWNDIGAGHIFADYFCDCLRYVPERKMWFFYGDGIWQPATGSLRAMKYCMELANLMYTFAMEIRDEDKRNAYMKYASRWRSSSYGARKRRITRSR